MVEKILHPNHASAIYGRMDRRHLAGTIDRRLRACIYGPQVSCLHYGQRISSPQNVDLVAGIMSARSFYVRVWLAPAAAFGIESSQEVRMKAAVISFSIFLVASICWGAMPVHTYSIVARDPQTGEIGVAVQSHYFSVGSKVLWAEAGVGAVATQSFVEVSYGPLGLELMKSGKSAPQALQALLAVDDGREVRQVAMIDADGKVGAHTGKKCIAEAGHQTGENYSVQANLMANAKVWPAMSRAFENSKGDLAERMMAALEAAQQVGGDIRGEQSAAILVVGGKRTGVGWKDRLVDLRVEDHPHPLQELKRLLKLQEAYRHEDAGDEYVAQKNMTAALQEYEAALKLAPDNDELMFWYAVGAYTGGEKQKALGLFRNIFERDERWIDLVKRLPASDLLPAKDVNEILAVAQRKK